MKVGFVPRILFLHGGPGMTAELERRQYGTTLPVHWWDQPHVARDNARPYEMLVDAAAAEAVRLSRENIGPVDLLANSFGSYLARSLLDRVPDRIGQITICGGIWDLSTAILRLGIRFAERSGDGDLKDACQGTAEKDAPEDYLALIARVSAMPGFLEYWAPSALEAREAMKVLVAQGRLIDWATCQSVMTAALPAPLAPPALPHTRRVRILLGRFDPYFDESDIPAWQALWPSATVQVVDAGHFLHLELPPSVWMPRSAADR